MIGCVARATGEGLVVDPVEMAECRWVGLADVRLALAQSIDTASPYVRGGEGGAAPALPPPGFYVPPPVAIAHHLMRAWAEAQVNSNM